MPQTVRLILRPENATDPTSPFTLSLGLVVDHQATRGHNGHSHHRAPIMTKTPTIQIAEQDAIDQFPRGVELLLSAMGIEGALVTDLSQVYDFLTYEGLTNDPALKAEIQAENTKILTALGEAVGRTVEPSDALWELARDAERHADEMARRAPKRQH